MFKFKFKHKSSNAIEINCPKKGGFFHNFSIKIAFYLYCVPKTYEL